MICSVGSQDNQNINAVLSRCKLLAIWGYEKQQVDYEVPCRKDFDLVHLFILKNIHSWIPDLDDCLAIMAVSRFFLVKASQNI